MNFYNNVKYSGEERKEGLRLVKLGIAFCQRFQFRCLHYTFRNTVFPNYMYLKFLLTINPHPLYKKNIPDTFNYAISGGNYVLDLTVLVLLKWPLEYTCANEQVYIDKLVKSTCKYSYYHTRPISFYTWPLSCITINLALNASNSHLKNDIHDRYKLIYLKGINYRIALYVSLAIYIYICIGLCCANVCRTL